MDDKARERSIDVNSPEVIGALDDCSLWSAAAGELLLENIPLRTGIRVLDVACGSGFPMLELAQRLGPDATVSGIDLRRHAINRAAQKARALSVENIELICGDAEAMPWENGRVDLIVSNLGVNNFEHPDLVLRECNRVAKTGAVIALTSNLVGHMREFYEVFERTLREANQSSKLDALHRHIEHRSTVERLAKFLSEAGFAPQTPITRTVPFRYADGTAFLNHRFIQMAFLSAWREIIAADDPSGFWPLLETNLNNLSAARGELVVTVPFAYIQAQS